MKYNIRNFEDRDSQSIIDIMNYFIENTEACYPDKKIGKEFVERIKSSDGYPFYVVENNDKKVLGFALLKKFREYDVFNRTAVITYFILPEYTGKGLGKKLLSLLIRDAKEMGIDNILAHISSWNEGSLNFHKKNGFFECGRFEKVAKKFNKDFDMIWMQKFI
ncbi:MAG: N-acetyltransferase family protein [Ignavibacteriaceae bacterium]